MMVEHESKTVDDTGVKPAGTTTLSLSPSATLERMACITLGNRFIWLVVILALYLISQLSYTQWQSNALTGTPRFDTMELMALVMVIIELALLATVLLTSISIPRTREAWYRHHPGQRFSYIATGFAAVLAILLVLVVLLAPVLYLHRYPELAREGIRIPLMLAQRAILIGLAALVTYNMIMLLRFYLRLPLWLAGLLGTACHVAGGYYVTWFSFTADTYKRLNDVFFYNQLWRYIDGFPNIQRTEVFHNIEMPYYAYYISAAAVLWIFTLLLWLPRASIESARETPG